MRFQHLSLSWKILIGIVPMFILFTTISVILQDNFQEKEMIDQAQSSAKMYASIIKESLVSMMVRNLAVDNSFIARINTLERFDSIKICINDLHLRQELLTPERILSLEAKDNFLKPKDGIQQFVITSGEANFLHLGDKYRAVVPFAATAVCQKCHEVPLGYTLGAADLHISFARIAEVNQANRQRSLYIFLAFTVLASLAATFIFARYVSRPIERLVTATKEIRKGNIDFHVIAAGHQSDERSHDELAFLSQQFDEMRIILREKILQLDSANQNLTERNREIEDALQRLRQAQERLVQSERLAVTAKMTAQLSHEINNPIHNIQSLLQSLERNMDGTGRAKELISVALEEIARMSALTRQMLNFYRGSMVQEEKVIVNLGTVLDDVVRAHEASMLKQNVVILVHRPTDPVLMEGSVDKLKQLFLNLIMNARDAMPKGGTTTITLRSDESNIDVEVMDTGVGIPAENVDKIFDAFFTTKKEVSGVGLGLFVCYGIMQQHAGTISVTSEVDSGTIFTLRFPRKNIHS
jgi:signal transduction histidine kinase